MRNFFKYLLVIIVLSVVLYVLYLYPGRIVINTWGDYNIYSNIFALAVFILLLLLLFYILRLLTAFVHYLFYQVSLQHTLAQYMKYIEVSDSINKEIQLNLINDIRDLKTLKLVSYLNSLILHKEYTRVFSIIRSKEHNSRLKNILAYTRVEAMLASGCSKDAKDICKYYLNSTKNCTWAFLKFYDIVTRDKPDYNIHDFKFLDNYLLHNKLHVSQNLIERIYCVINYEIALDEYHNEDGAVAKRLQNLVKKFPKFIPGYILLFNYLNNQDKKDEAVKLIVSSWQHNITYENSILLDNVFSSVPKERLLKEANKLLNHTNNKDRVYCLLAIIYAAHNEFINVNESLLPIENNLDSLIKLSKLYVLLRENDIIQSKVIVEEVAQLVPLSWWNQHLNSVMPQ